MHWTTAHISLFYSVEPVRHGTFDLEYVKPERPLNGLCEQLNAHGKSCGELSVEAAMRYIPENLPDFVFLYLGFPDEAGHMHGWMSDEYMLAVIDAGIWQSRFVPYYRKSIR